MSTFNNAMSYGLGYYGSSCCGGTSSGMRASNVCGSVDVNNAANVMMAPMTLGEQSAVLRKMNAQKQSNIGVRRAPEYVDPVKNNPGAVGVL